MSIKRSPEVINLCNQAIEEERRTGSRKVFGSQRKRVQIDANIQSSESSDEFRVMGIPTLTESLSVAQIITTSVLLGIQIYLYFESGSIEDLEVSLWLNCLWDWGSLLMFYGTAILTIFTVKQPTKARFQCTLLLQSITGLFAIIMLSQSLVSIVEADNVETLRSEQPIRLINYIKITIASLMTVVVGIIIFLLSRATACCSDIFCGYDKRAVAFDMTSESQP